MNLTISSSELQSALTGNHAPLVIDVRKSDAFRAAPDMVQGALRRDPECVATWAAELPRAGAAVVYCVHGHAVSQKVAAALAATGLSARYLVGGIEEGWKAAGGALMAKAGNASTRWVTRERPKIDRIACPWLIARFVDADAEFLYVPVSQVLDTARETSAIPYDIPDVAFSHDGEFCSFDAFLKTYRLTDPALERLALIVRGADTARLELAPQAPGLAAISLGLSHIFQDDHEMLKYGMVMYDALYAWCRQGQDEIHTWNPAAYR
jgi:rhodanese-related sulfurtransferase